MGWPERRKPRGLRAPEQPNRNAYLQSVTRLIIQFENKGPPQEWRPSHAAPADLEPFCSVSLTGSISIDPDTDEPGALRRPKAGFRFVRLSHITRFWLILDRGAARQFQFPQIH
jgi:hypothetical protein